MAFEKKIREHSQLKEKALSMGGTKKLDQRKQQGILNARERIDYLLDPGSFEESGLFTRSVLPEAQDETPTDGKIAGFGKIEKRQVGIIANDFTVKGASSTALNAKKMGHIKQVATTRGFPMVYLGESSGARMPDIMGARGMAFSLEHNLYLRKRETPWANAILGNAFGSSAWYACMSDFNVIRKGSCMAVSSARLVSLATRGEVNPEDLGGWKLHSEITGLADLVADTDEQALDAIKRFLSYMPSNHMEAPPRAAVPKGSDEPVKDILDLIPPERTRVYDVKKVILKIVDIDSLFELKARFGMTVVTALARIDGKTVGIVANNPLYKGGAIDADACDKVCSFIVLCDSFNIPMVFFVDQPGFLIGIEAERKKITGKIINWMNAMALATMPKIVVQFRKNYGQAWLNMGGGKNADEFAAWWLAETSFMDPSSAVGVVFGVNREAEPARYEELLDKMVQDTSAHESASVYGIKQVIDPSETRDYLKNMLDIHDLRITRGVGQHLMRSWPTTF
ncbi:MAG: carboxyl transferase domain-containing protein [Pseudomonadota bacterium]